ncbi:MAG: TonB-dependent receptor [Bacteroidia bacterium]|nr:TonB-dependent receptor [Bacteroidia bacterium]
MNGCRRFTPVDVEKSRELAEVVLDNSQRNGEQHKDYIRFDLRIAYKVHKPKFTQEWSIDIQNLTNRKNIFNRVYNPTKNEWRTTYQTGLFPIGLYRITF